MIVDVTDYYPTAEAAEAAAVAALTERAYTMIGSRILGIAAQVRELKAEGMEICDLTVGDFSPAQFSIPAALSKAITDHLVAGDTNYPPSDGLPELRRAIADFYERELGVRFPVSSVVVGSGARPPLHAVLACLLDEGDAYVYGLPTWNNEYYAHLNGARMVTVPTTPEDGFQLTPELLAPHLSEARVVHLNSPLNPCGTCITEQALAGICRMIVEENARRTAEGRKAVFLLFDMVYWMLTYGEARHHHPVALVPEVAPYVAYIDALSKNFAGTGLRVGWGIVPPYIQPKLKALIGHIGAWAPRPIQSAAAWFLGQPGLIEDYLAGFKAQLQARLDKIDKAFTAMNEAGLPVEAIGPQGAIYLSVRVDLVGRPSPAGGVFETNEQIREFLLKEARVAVVPFRAFGLTGEDGWFRMSVGAVGLDELDQALGRLEAAVRGVCA